MTILENISRTCTIKMNSGNPIVTVLLSHAMYRVLLSELGSKAFFSPNSNAVFFYTANGKIEIRPCHYIGSNKYSKDNIEYYLQDPDVAYLVES